MPMKLGYPSGQACVLEVRRGSRVVFPRVPKSSILALLKRQPALRPSCAGDVPHSGSPAFGVTGTGQEDLPG